jgi:hypothetical protein
MLSPDYPLLVDAENVSRSNDYHASYGFLQRIAHSHSRGCLRPVNLTGWTGHPALDLLSPHSHVLPRRAGKAAHGGRDITPPLQIEARTIEKIGLLALIASKNTN